MKTAPTHRQATLTQAAGLLLCLLSIAAVCLLLAARRGPAAVAAAAAATVGVTTAMMTAFLVTAMSSASSAAPALLGIAFRTGVPLALLVAGRWRPDWVAAGFHAALLGCYLPGLAVETLFAARRRPPSLPSPAPRESSQAV